MYECIGVAYMWRRSKKSYPQSQIHMNRRFYVFFWNYYIIHHQFSDLGFRLNNIKDYYTKEVLTCMSACWHVGTFEVYKCKTWMGDGVGTLQVYKCTSIWTKKSHNMPTCWHANFLILNQITHFQELFFKMAEFVSNCAVQLFFQPWPWLLASGDLCICLILSICLSIYLSAKCGLCYSSKTTEWTEVYYCTEIAVIVYLKHIFLINCLTTILSIF